MTQPGAETEMCVLRSRLRRNALIMLCSLSEAYPRQLARAIGVDSTRLKWIMYGRPPFYDPDLSLVPLGLAEEVRTDVGRKFVITEKGRRKARQLTSRWTRRRGRNAEAREAGDRLKL